MGSEMCIRDRSGDVKAEAIWRILFHNVIQISIMKPFISLFLGLLISCGAFAQTAVELDSTFLHRPGASALTPGPRKVAVQADGKILAAGGITYFNG